MRPKAPVQPRQPRARLICALAALGVLLAAQPSAEGHLGHSTVPPVDLTFTIRGTEVTALIDMEKIQILSWGEPAQPHRNLEATVLGTTALQKLGERLEIAIDGVVVPPVLRFFGDPPPDEKVKSPHVKLGVAYPTSVRPTSLRITWKDFYGIYWEGAAQIPLIIEADAHVDTATLARHEPEYIWHLRPPAAFRTAAPPPAAPAPLTRLPLLPAGLAVLALLLPFLGPLRRRGGLARWAPSGVVLGAGVAVFCAGAGAVETPWGRPLPPTEPQARSIFTSLLHNVYRAMDAKTEREIYALLSASVEHTILDGLYGDIYESLVLRDQGGVVARVEDVGLQDIAIGYPENGSTTQFTATAAWVLKATVSHMGHTHERQNLYRADVVLRHDGTAWRIASVTMLERKRLDNGKGGLLDTPKDIPPPGPAAAPAAAPAGALGTDAPGGLPPPVPPDAAPGASPERPR